MTSPIINPHLERGEEGLHTCCENGAYDRSIYIDDLDKRGVLDIPDEEKDQRSDPEYHCTRNELKLDEPCVEAEGSVEPDYMPRERGASSLDEEYDVERGARGFHRDRQCEKGTHVDHPVVGGSEHSDDA
ncbi:hypothetical protein H0H81_011435 [Sphagnurus paluster]|uniref:Uncharacterized protein n=1 Tax=Sphagnurus paluster TaxID=117069 RepID=A0A9P7KKI3_9AGAR|nr:hypothetical protein H0H81_011435 [Sphagnurus paluster]